MLNNCCDKGASEGIAAFDHDIEPHNFGKLYDILNHYSDYSIIYHRREILNDCKKRMVLV